MNLASLSPDQINRIARSVRRQLLYFDRLTGRMCQTHFPHNDPLKIEAERVREAIQRLIDVLESVKQKA